MFDMITSLVANTFNRAGSSLSIPIMDGALKPNNLLEGAPVFAQQEGLEDLALAPDGKLYAACGNSVAEVGKDGKLETVATYDHPVTAIAVMPDGEIAVALGASVVFGTDPGKHATVNHVDGSALTAVTAIRATADGALLICDGSATHPFQDWRNDLMEKGRTGRLVRYDRASGSATTLASGLGYAFGAHADEAGRVLVSETWRHQVVQAKDGRTTVAVPPLPGYPARMAPAAGGGFWLSLFSARTQLVEFVLRESDYRKEMMQTIDPEYWVAPAFNSGDDFREPLQAGGVKQMGILKPWAPPRSYGLVVRFNDDFIPVYSLHSRVGGEHHGIVAVAQRGDELFALSKGSGRILRLLVSEIEAHELQEVGQ